MQKGVMFIHFKQSEKKISLPRPPHLYYQHLLQSFWLSTIQLPKANPGHTWDAKHANDIHLEASKENERGHKMK